MIDDQLLFRSVDGNDASRKLVPLRPLLLLLRLLCLGRFLRAASSEARRKKNRHSEEATEKSALLEISSTLHVSLPFGRAARGD